MLVDSHCHLDHAQLVKETDAIVDRARRAGIRRMVTIGTRVQRFPEILAIAERFDDVFCSVGTHPHHAAEEPEVSVGDLVAIAAHPKVVAIGEAGLDYHRLPSRSILEPTPAWLAETPFNDPREIEGSIRDGAYVGRQALIFQQQLELAAELGLNVVIHERDAWEDTLELIKPYTGRLRAVFHCFGKSPEQMREVLAMGHLVSFTGIVTFKNAPLVHASAREVPGDRYMVETDCPYLAPVPHRGKRCEPAHVRVTAEFIAQLRGETLDLIAADTTNTANAFFRRPPTSL